MVERHVHTDVPVILPWKCGLGMGAQAFDCFPELRIIEHGLEVSLRLPRDRNPNTRVRCRAQVGHLTQSLDQGCPQCKRRYRMVSRAAVWSLRSSQLLLDVVHLLDRRFVVDREHSVVKRKLVVHIYGFASVRVAHSDRQVTRSGVRIPVAEEDF